MKISSTGRLILPHPIKGPVYLIGRQPILTPQMDVYGYELVYRPTSESYLNGFETDHATLSVILNTFSQAGLQAVVGSKKAFINIARNFLIGNYSIPLPPGKTVLEIPASTNLDQEAVRALKELSQLGYEIALDEVTSFVQAEKLAGIANIAKIEISGTRPQEIHDLVYRLKRLGMRVVAEKVEIMNDFYACRDSGFDLLQGFFFCQPDVVPVRKIISSRVIILQALAKLHNPDVSVSEVEDILGMDVTIGFRLLKLINSGYYALSVPITSLRHAINLLGLNQLKSWLGLLLMAKFNEKPHELSAVAVSRAYMARALAKDMNLPNIESFGLAGMFSVLDAMLDMPMKEVIDGINLSKDISTALVERKGFIGEMINAIEDFERGSFERLLLLGFRPEVINQITLDTIEWTEKFKEMTAGS